MIYHITKQHSLFKCSILPGVQLSYCSNRASISALPNFSIRYGPDIILIYHLIPADPIRNQAQLSVNKRLLIHRRTTDAIAVERPNCPLVYIVMCPSVVVRLAVQFLGVCSVLGVQFMV